MYRTPKQKSSDQAPVYYLWLCGQLADHTDFICSRCNLTEWLGQLIPLELEHIDGDNSNNSLENLCLLCPNCHALTPTYRGKNIGKK